MGMSSKASPNNTKISPIMKWVFSGRVLRIWSIPRVVTRVNRGVDPIQTASQGVSRSRGMILIGYIIRRTDCRPNVWRLIRSIYKWLRSRKIADTLPECWDRSPERILCREADIHFPVVQLVPKKTNLSQCNGGY